MLDSLVANIAQAARLGDVWGVIHAAGVSPSQAPPRTILSVDLYGTAVVLEEFGEDRIRDTPLSESAFVGAGIGAALFFVASISVIMEYLGDGRGSDATVGMGIAALSAFLAWWFGTAGVGWIRRVDG